MKTAIWAGGEPMHERLQQQPSAHEPDRFPMAHALQGRGIQVRLADPHGWNPLKLVGLTRHHLSVAQCINLLQNYRDVDAVICQGFVAPTLLLAFRRLAKFRPPVIIYDAILSDEWYLGRKFNRFNIPRADVVTVVNSSQVPVARDLYNARGKVEYVPLPIDIDFFSPQHAFGQPPISPYILSVGLDAGRDYATLIQATSDIGVDLVIKTGRHPLHFDRKAFPHVQVIDHHISYEELRRLYFHAAIVVVPTLSTINASGVTSLQEGLAMARPVIVSQNPALADYIPAADAALTVPIGDAIALRGAIIDLLANPVAAQEMGRKGRKHVSEKFTIEQCAQAFASAAGLG
jgi:glycosyltransferase involved in cell wall biosynthesis